MPINPRILPFYGNTGSCAGQAPKTHYTKNKMSGCWYEQPPDGMQHIKTDNAPAVDSIPHSR